ncbi:uncharacterized protein OCT59_000222 [Rhizophagus irregularis]|nr:hypothetical protein OCT59_000222 [Rhizophagus irregularis]
MSQNRRACVSHHKNLDIFHNIKKHTPVPINNIINNKRFHATLIHKQWQHHVKKHIYSNRLGISYDVSYLTNGHKALSTYNERRNNSLSTSNTHSPATTSQPILLKEENTWHETLGIWIPNDLFPYVTDEPVYISKRQATLKGRQHDPGKKERLLREEDLSARAKLWGTSSNSIEYREEMTKDLTKFQDHYHKKITPLIERRAVLKNRITQGKNVYKTNKQLLQLERELGVFKIDYFSVIDDNAYHYRYKGHTSDDTKQLELRPHKRPPTLTINIDRHNTEVKKLRLDIPSPEDSKVFASP